MLTDSKRNRRAQLVLTIVLGCYLTAGGETGESSRDMSVSEQLVKSALFLELEGDNVHRKAALEAAVRWDANNETARWHLGHIFEDGAWVPIREAMYANGSSEAIRKYEELRAGSDDSPKSHLAIARWASQQQLTDRARLHWRRVADSPQAKSSQRQAAIRALNLKRVDGVMLDKQQRDRLALQQEQLDEEFKRWEVPLKKWKKGLASNREAVYEKAVGQLRAVKDPAAILPMEVHLSPLSEAVANEVVGVLASIPGARATESLARHALQIPWTTVVEKAAAALNSRPRHEYVPMLLNSLQSPLQSNHEMIANGNEVRVDRIVYTEGIDANYLTQTSMRTSVGTRRPDLARFRANRVIQRERREIDQYNRSVAEQNQRIFNVLRQATDEVLAPRPADWWDWWHKYNDVFSGRETETEVRQLAYVDSAIDDVAYAEAQQPRGECFVLGTPVWTETGLRPVEQVMAGDRVLAQDQESGELAFRVVLQSTQRDPQEVLRLTIDDETIVCTKGHPFWINGTGWRMAALVKSGDHVHTVGGSATIADVALHDSREEVYNLVVDGLSNYFVGELGALVHDSTYRQPTRCVIPGLVVCQF